ncbi:hypothetical protein ACM792_21985 [Metapseudomonas otitidis]|uniref:hypothetical protein n=1 Tax=Metapseudomonas otitidis TaxID=319939 RepID=UPI0039FCB828
MGRRSTKGEGALIGVALLIGAPVLAFQKISEAGALPVVIGVLAVGAALWGAMKFASRARRVAYLRKKYDEDTVKRILNGTIWERMTEEQLVDCIGRPLAIDHKNLKTIDRQVWKYYRRGVNRYGLRVTIENGRVSGWDSKG